MKYTVIGGGLLPQMAVKDPNGKIEARLLQIKIHKEAKEAELRRTIKKPKRKKRKHKR